MKKTLLVFVLSLVLLLSACALPVELVVEEPSTSVPTTQAPVSVQGELPDFAGEPYIVVGDNVPLFTPGELTTDSYESYSPLDALGRCGVAMACVGTDLMPTEDRGNISQVKPTGWQSVQYDFVDGKSLYNRCHLIAFQLTGENANERNLITGTRYFNVQGMLPFEEMVGDYVRETGNHVMYRVTPVFEGDNLVADGAYMEGYSVEDNGEGICFYIYAYNNQPGVVIDYATGDNWLDESFEEGEEQAYILNTSTKKFHRENCAGADSIKKENRESYTGSREELIAYGYEPCGSCNP